MRNVSSPTLLWHVGSRGLTVKIGAYDVWFWRRSHYPQPNNTALQSHFHEELIKMGDFLVDFD